MKNVFIMGDSYSTYKDYIPNGYPFYYCKEGRENSPLVTKMNLEQTWWMQVLNNLKGNLVLNDSWSGSTVCHTRYDGEDCSKTSSFIFRFNKMREQGFFKNNKIDTVLIFGGTNDNWANSPLGEPKFSNITEKDMFNVLPAFCYLSRELRKELPNAEICFILNTDFKKEMVDCILDCAKKYNLITVQLKDIEKDFRHPNVLGMKSIADQVTFACLNK